MIVRDRIEKKFREKACSPLSFKLSRFLSLSTSLSLTDLNFYDYLMEQNLKNSIDRSLKDELK